MVLWVLCLVFRNRMVLCFWVIDEMKFIVLLNSGMVFFRLMMWILSWVLKMYGVIFGF